MQLSVRLDPESPVHFPFSYQPKLAAALYQALASDHREFADDLHEGEAHRSRIKLFAFSPLHSKMTEIHRPDPRNRLEGGIVFKGPIFFKVSSPWPELMNGLGEGLLAAGQLRIGSQLLRVCNVQLLPPPRFEQTMTWHPTKTGSIVTTWSRRSDNTKLFAFPDKPADGQACELLLRTNLIHKWQRLCEIRKDIATSWSGVAADSAREAFTPDDVRVAFAVSADADQAYTTRLHHIKGSPVRSWRGAVAVSAPPALQRTAWACGLGEMNSMGFGLVEEVGGQ